MYDTPIVLATTNEGKITELERLFAVSDIETRSLLDFGPVPPVIEDGETFKDNAYKKAYFMAKVLGLPALADDSGLVVEALGGAPGIYSSRYAGGGATDEENIIKLLKEMKDKENRKAFFESVIIIALPWGPALAYVGRCEGEILHEPRGENGFGYDPVFYFPPLNKTFAQMTGEEKNRVSHRGRAIFELRNELDKVMIWLEQRMAERPF
jgi:XTP/dITP diphosphohydrolase